MLLNVDDLVKKEKKEGMNTIIFAYDDLDYALEFYVKCLKEEIKPIIGQKITMGGQEVVLLCKDSEGYRILCRHSADSERTFTKDESSHFILTTLKDCNNFEEQIPYIFPKDYFSKENLYKRQIDNLPDIPFPAGIGSAAEYLTRLVNNGVKSRYETPSPKVQMRVKQELDAIFSNHLEKYFLVIWEMTAMCRKRGIMYSTSCDESNCSMICYVLGITDIDPLEHDLYFGLYFSIQRDLSWDLIPFQNHKKIQNKDHAQGDQYQ